MYSFIHSFKDLYSTSSLLENYLEMLLSPNTVIINSSKVIIEHYSISPLSFTCVIFKNFLKYFYMFGNFIKIIP